MQHSNNNVGSSWLSLYTAALKGKLSNYQLNEERLEKLKIYELCLKANRKFLSNLVELNGDLKEYATKLSSGAIQLDSMFSKEDANDIGGLKAAYDKLISYGLPEEEAYKIIDPRKLLKIRPHLNSVLKSIGGTPQQGNHIWCKVDGKGKTLPPWAKKPDWVASVHRNHGLIWVLLDGEYTNTSGGEKNSIKTVLCEKNNMMLCGEVNWRVPSIAEIVELCEAPYRYSFSLNVLTDIWAGKSDEFGRAESYNMDKRLKKITGQKVMLKALIVSKI